jgi:hypothetical protein
MRKSPVAAIVNDRRGASVVVVTTGGGAKIGRSVAAEIGWSFAADPVHAPTEVVIKSNASRRFVTAAQSDGFRPAGRVILIVDFRRLTPTASR